MLPTCRPVAGLQEILGRRVILRPGHLASKKRVEQCESNEPYDEASAPTRPDPTDVDEEESGDNHSQQPHLFSPIGGRALGFHIRLERIVVIEALPGTAHRLPPHHCAPSKTDQQYQKSHCSSRLGNRHGNGHGEERSKSSPRSRADASVLAEVDKLLRRDFHAAHFSGPPDRLHAQPVPRVCKNGTRILTHNDDAADV